MGDALGQVGLREIGVVGLPLMVVIFLVVGDVLKEGGLLIEIDPFLLC